MPDKGIYYRIVSLWVICESLLGGVIHGLKLPVSGLIVGSSAVICICMIGNFYQVRGAILKATILVAICKMMLSPHSPPPAYIAVFFQGLFGEIIFMSRRNYKLNCIMLGVIALLESGVQRILVMTILFGKDIWTALDAFISGIIGSDSRTSYSFYIVGGYVVLHIITGILIGIFSANIPQRIKNLPDNYLILPGIDEGQTNQPKRKRIRLIHFIWLILIGVLIYSLVTGKSVIPENTILRLLLRSILILINWIVISPFLMRLFQKWLERKRKERSGDINEILLILPSMRYLFNQSWKKSSDEKGLKRLKLFFTILFYNALRNE